MLVHSYELFKMDVNETITEMFTRFTGIINELNALGRTYTNSNLVRKLLRSLPRTWEAKVTAIQEAKYLSKIPLDELIGSLMIHEITMQDHDQGKDSKKKRSIALKSFVLQDIDSENKEECSDNEEDLAMTTLKFKNFFKKKNFKKYHKNSKKKEKKKEIICYKCKNP